MKTTFQILSESEMNLDVTFALLPHFSPVLPSLAIERALIWRGAPGEVISYAANSFVDTFYSLFPEVSFVELLRLRAKSPASHVALFDRWNIDMDEDFEHMSGRILQLSLPVQTYLAEKKFFPRDLRFFLLVSDLDLRTKWRPFFEFAIEKRFSKSEFSQACDLLALYFQRVRKTGELYDSKHAPLFLEKLKDEVFPNANRADEQMNQRLRDQPWYQKSLMRWTRQGDRTGLELKAWIQGPVEARRLERTMQSMLETLKEDDRFWHN